MRALETDDRNDGRSLLTDEQNKIFDEAISTHLELSNVFGMTNPHIPRDEAATLAAYLLFKAIQSAQLADASYQRVAEGMLESDEQITYMFRDCVTDEAWEKLRAIGRQHQAEIFAIAAGMTVRGDSVDVIPEGMAQLSEGLLKIDGGMSVADIGCGRGTFLLELGERADSLDLCGYELDTYAVAAARIKAKLRSSRHGNSVIFRQINAFDLATGGEKPAFDRVFSNYPLAMKPANSPSMKRFFDEYAEKCPWLPTLNTADWAFNTLVVELMKENGRAVALMTRGSSQSLNAKAAREYFVEAGLIECVITLPERMLPTTNVATSLVVFSHGNEGVRLIDGSAFCESGRRYKFLSEEGVGSLIKAADEDGEFSKVVSLDDLRANDYILEFNRFYESPTGRGGNYRTLDELTHRIHRGTTSKAKDLDIITVPNESNVRYLSASNVDGGVIDYGKLVYLSELDQSIMRGLVHNGDVIVPRNGDTAKIAVIDPTEEMMICVSGNFYALAIDEYVANPYYVAAFLKSEEGQQLIQSKVVGLSATSISVKDLKEIPIPLLPVEEQEAIAEKYKEALNKIRVARVRLYEAERSLTEVFDTWEVD